jgi:Zn-dependent protease with chaperone function
MRWRQFQENARSQTWRLLWWFCWLVLGLVLAVNALLALTYKAALPWSIGWPELFFEANTGLVLLFVLGGCWMELWRLRDGGGARVARWMGGVLVQDTGDALLRRLINVVDEMALASGQRPITVYLLPKESSINAFVAGWSPEDACLCVTQGALDHLSRAELQGLIAHEYGHVAEDDGRLCMTLLALVWGLSLVHGWGRDLMSPDDDGHVGPLGWLVGAVFSVAGWLGWLTGRLLQAAVSRQREYLADARAIQYTRSKDGLGQVLRKVWHEQQSMSARWHHPQADALSFLWLSSAGSAHWLSSHPPLSERIVRIYGSPRPPMPANRMPDDESPNSALASEYASEGMMAAAPLVPKPAPAPPLVRALPVPSPAAPARLLIEPETAQALGKLDRLSGPLQRRMSVLALMMTPGNEIERQWWLKEAAELHEAPALLDTVMSLPPQWRLPEFERQLQLMAQEPISLRRALVMAARQLLRVDGRVSARDRLWWLALRHKMEAQGQASSDFMRPAGTGQARELAQLGASERVPVVQLTAYLARLVPLDGDQAQAVSPEGTSWYQRVLIRCAEAGQAIEPCQSPDADGLMHALSGVRELSWALRPQLMRAWVEEALNHSHGGVLSMDCADALRLTSELIDTPMPPALLSHYPA